MNDNQPENAVKLLALFMIGLILWEIYCIWGAK